jgi:hypothetical protein
LILAVAIDSPTHQHEFVDFDDLSLGIRAIYGEDSGEVG